MTDDRTLDTLDDATLRGIAYGRADSESERMRAQRAARILADRGDHARGAGAALPSVEPNVEPAASADADSDGNDDNPTGWWTRARRVGAALLVGGLVVGAGAAIAYERLIPALADESLAVFEREQSESDIPPVDQFGESLPGESRLLGTVGDVTIYAVRTEPGAVFGSPALGHQICLTGAAENIRFIPTTCTPETVFRKSGLSGAVIGFDVMSRSASGVPDFTHIISVDWGPRGRATLTDMSEEVAAETEGTFSPAEIAAGDDMQLTRRLADSPIAENVVGTLASVVPPVTLGPALIGEVPTEGLGSIGVYASIHAGSAENPVVCMTLGVSGEFTTDCAPVAVFRTEGLAISLPTPSSVLRVALDPGSDLLSVEERTG